MNSDEILKNYLSDNYDKLVIALKADGHEKKFLEDYPTKDDYIRELSKEAKQWDIAEDSDNLTEVDLAIIEASNNLPKKANVDKKIMKESEEIWKKIFGDSDFNMAYANESNYVEIFKENKSLIKIPLGIFSAFINKMLVGRKDAENVKVSWNQK